jgi:putative membrane protein insertion efficiency factor
MSIRPAPFRMLLRAPALVASALIGVYRYGISPVIGPRCRFFPSCSDYGQQALDRFGLLRGLWLTGVRLVRCHPWNDGGLDPLPDTFDPPAAGRYLGRVLRGSRAHASGRGESPARPLREAPPSPPHRSWK